MRGIYQQKQGSPNDFNSAAVTRSFITPGPVAVTKKPYAEKTRFAAMAAEADTSEEEDEIIPDNEVTPDKTPSPPATPTPGLDSPDVIARLASLVSTHMQTSATKPTGMTPAKSPHTMSSSSPLTSSTVPGRPVEATLTEKRACYNKLIAGTCSRLDKDCMYSHDPKVINEARTQCMAKWRANPKTPFNNLTTLDRSFPRQDDVDDPSGYSDSAREAIYEYFDSAVAAVVEAEY